MWHYIFRENALSKKYDEILIFKQVYWHITRPPSEKKIKTNPRRLLSPVALGCFKAAKLSVTVDNCVGIS